MELGVQPAELRALLGPALIVAHQAETSSERDCSTPQLRLKDKDLAATLKLTPKRWNYVKKLLLEPPEISNRALQQQTRQSLLSRVVAPDTLSRHVGFNLKQRAAMLNEECGSKLFSAYKLRQLYRQSSITHKTIRVKKVPVNPNKELIERASHDLFAITQRMADRGFELVYVDECCFTFRGYSRLEWAPKYANLYLP